MSKILNEIIRELKNGESIDFTKTEFTYKEYLSELKLDLLLENNIDGKTYLDYLLEGIKNNKIRNDLNQLLRWYSNPEGIAKYYIALAKHDMIPYIEDLKPFDLLYSGWDSSTVLEILLNIDEELTFNKILTDEIKADVEIAGILKSRGFYVDKYNVANEEKNIYINNVEIENNKKIGVGPLAVEGECLLKKLYDLFKNDNISDISLIEAFIISYRQSLIVNYKVALLELKKLIEIKEQNMSKFVLLSLSSDAYFDEREKSIYSSKLISNVLLHEAGHALHYFLANDSIPENLYEGIKKIQKKPENLEKIESFAKKYNDVQSEIAIAVKEEYDKYFAEFYTDERIKEINMYLNKESSDKKSDLVLLGIDDEVIDKVLKEAFTVKEYIEHQKRIFIKEYTISYMRMKFGSMVAVSDILDAIYEGKLSDGRLVNVNGVAIPKSYGHGISYYSNINDCFGEIIADYASLVKAADGKEYLDLLQSIIGNELYNLIVNYYNNNILNGEIITKEKSLK